MRVRCCGGRLSQRSIEKHRGVDSWSETSSASPAVPVADGEPSITDAVYSLNFQFLAGPRPPPPFPEEGKDETADALTCRS